MKRPVIYLDHQSTTPVDEHVIDAMLPWLRGQANANSPHVAGQAARDAVEAARAEVAALVNAEPREIVFTSGATEAANIAVRSLARTGSRAVVSPSEHPCVLEAVRALCPDVDVTVLPVDRDGVVDVENVGEAVDGDVCLLAVMAVGNETGTVQPSEELGAAAEFHGVPFLCDLTQAAGKIPVDVAAWNVSAGLLSAHKLYGPQGVGALVWRGDAPPSGFHEGGSHERGVRPGTPPVALCVGFGSACRLAQTELHEESARVALLSRRLLRRLRDDLPGLVVNGASETRVPHALNLSIPWVDADALCGSLPEVAISTGTACSAGAFGHSPTLAAMGLGEDRMKGSFRIGLGRATTEEEIDRAADLIVRAASRQRGAPGGGSR